VTPYWCVTSPLNSGLSDCMMMRPVMSNALKVSLTAAK
jgi:hypothetical protein